MQTQAYFDDIQLQILHELRKATSSIHIAVAWFTDPDIVEQLCQKAGSGVRVELIVVNDSINRKGGLQYERLRDLGGMFMMVGDNTKNSTLMHNKFCVIDSAAVITGSYNWSRKAQQNSENITVISDHPELARQFIDEFESLVERHSGKGVSGADFGKIVARIEALRLVIELDDEDDIELQLAKLKKLLSGGNEYDEVKKIVAQIEDDQLDQAIAAIKTFVHTRKQISVYVDQEIPELTLELKALEFQVGSLEDEKTELEKLLHTFNYRHTIEVGEIIRRILLLRREELKVEAEQDAEKEEEYQEAQQDYDEYDHNFQETSKQEIFKVTEAEQQELKATFRACSMMCHPDVVAQEFKAEASEMFSRLNEANGKNDVPAVKTIYEKLQKEIYAPMSATISDAQKLHGQVVRIRGKVKELAVAISAIRTTDAYRKIVAIEDWDEYFTTLKQQLQEELKRIQSVQARPDQNVFTVKKEQTTSPASIDLGIELVHVPGGSFDMGNTFDDGSDQGGYYENELPVHEVRLDSFFIGKYPVTQRQWQMVMGSNPSNFKPSDFIKSAWGYPVDIEALPVDSVSWDDIQVFLTKLNQLTGKVYRLPTEAEWEYAARSGGKKEEWAGTSEIDELSKYANYDFGDGFQESTIPVGMGRPNGLGIYDMSGNVWEWCSDWYDEVYYRHSALANPPGAASGNSRVRRGGGWINNWIHIRATRRCYGTPNITYDHYGFRLALSLGQPTPKMEQTTSLKRIDQAIELVYVPGGSFEMGDTFGYGEEDEQPVHEVRLDSFSIGKYPVTQGQWQVVMGSNPSHFQSSEKLPVECVSWDDAQDFLTKLNQLSGKGYRLPTEAEWEYAARSGGKKERWAGTSDERELGDYAWFEENSGYCTHPVGTKKPNGLGIYDMSGNVDEWCSDSYDDAYYSHSALANPQGATSGLFCVSRSRCVLRGGRWFDSPGNVRAAKRDRDWPYVPFHYVNFRGLRLVLPLDHFTPKMEQTASIEWLHKAIELEGNGDLTGLRNHSLHWTQAQPVNANAWFYLGEAYRNEYGYFAEAILAFRRAVHINPEYAEAWLGLGFSHYRHPNEYTIEAFQQAIRINPEDDTAWLGLGDAYCCGNEFDKGTQAYWQAIRINPENAEAWRGIGDADTEDEQFFGASVSGLQAYLHVVRIYPEDTITWRKIGEIYEQEQWGSYKKAIDAYQQVKRILNQDTNLKVDDDEKMNEILVGIRRDFKASMDRKVDEMNEVLERHYKAIERYQQIIRINPEDARTWYDLGNAYHVTDQPEKAIEAFQQAIRINPEDISYARSLKRAIQNN